MNSELLIRADLHSKNRDTVIAYQLTFNFILQCAHAKIFLTEVAITVMLENP